MRYGRSLLCRPVSAAALALTGVSLTLLTGCTPLAGAFSTATTVLWGGVVYMPLRSLVGAVLRQIVVGG